MLPQSKPADLEQSDAAQCSSWAQLISAKEEGQQQGVTFLILKENNASARATAQHAGLQLRVSKFGDDLM